MSIIYDALQKIDGQEPGQPQPVGPEPPQGGKRTRFTKNQIMVPIVLVLSVVAVLLILRDIKFLKEKKSKPKKEPVSIILTEAPRPVVPVANVTAPQVSADGISLEGIVYSAVDPIAMVNGKIVHVSDVVNDYRITAINPNSIDVENTKDNTTKTITLPK